MSDSPQATHTNAQAYLWDGFLLFATPAIKNGMHSHYPASLIIGVEDSFEMELKGHGIREYDMALMAPNETSSLDSRGKPIVDILIDPDADAFAAFKALLGGWPVVSWSKPKVDPIREQCRKLVTGELCCRDARHFVDDLLNNLADYQPPAPPDDERIVKVLEVVRNREQESPSTEVLAEMVGLSESRLMHLFKEQLGLPLRQYLLWQKVRRAIRSWSQGAALSEIAHQAGFYDQAHFARTIRKMVDFPPSFLANPGNVRIHDCQGE